jgi:hypothetical protein
MVVVVGGHTRNIGKTSVVCGIIQSLPDWHWTAIKITQFGHGVCSRNGEPCPCSDPVHPVAITPEDGASPTTDSGRFLASGATRAFWVRTPAGALHEAMPRLRKLITPDQNVIIESNSILRLLRPDFCAMVLDGSIADFKPTSLRFLDRADALVVTSTAPLAWPQVPQALLRNKPRFTAPPPTYQNPGLITTIREATLKTPHPSADPIHR